MFSNSSFRSSFSHFSLVHFIVLDCVGSFFFSSCLFIVSFAYFGICMPPVALMLMPGRESVNDKELLTDFIG